MEEKEKLPARFWQRWGALILGMMCVGSGIAMTTRADLGTTPLSSAPYTVTCITGITLGTTTVIMNMLFFLGQWVLLGKNFQFGKNLLQLPLVLLFGLFIDAAMWVLSFFTAEHYAVQILQNLAGNALLALGIVLEIASCTIALPGDGVVIAASMRFHQPMGRTKFCIDWMLVALAAAIGLIFAQTIIGIREGTVLSAITTGMFVKFWLRISALQRLKERNSV